MGQHGYGIQPNNLRHKWPQLGRYEMSSTGKSNLTAELDETDRVRLAMRYLNLNQSELAEVMGVTRAAVSAWLHKSPERRMQPSAQTHIKMAEALNVTVEWITGALDTGGPDMNEVLVRSLQEIKDQLPSLDVFLNEVDNCFKDEDDEFLSVGFNDRELGYIGHDFEVDKIAYDYVGENIILNVDISKKPYRSFERLTELVWPLLMAKRIDETAGRSKRRYQLLLINPPQSNRQTMYEYFIHQSRLLGVQVSVREKADAQETCNLIADPFFKDGVSRWPQPFVNLVQSLRN